MRKGLGVWVLFNQEAQIQFVLFTGTPVALGTCSFHVEPG